MSYLNRNFLRIIKSNLKKDNKIWSLDQVHFVIKYQMILCDYLMGNMNHLQTGMKWKKIISTIQILISIKIKKWDRLIQYRILQERKYKYKNMQLNNQITVLILHLNFKSILHYHHRKKGKWCKMMRWNSERKKLNLIRSLLIVRHLPFQKK